VSVFTSMVHLMLDPDDLGQLHIAARQHPDTPTTFFVDLDTLRCHISISGEAEPVLAVVERMRAELRTALRAAGRHDLTDPAAPQPATTAG
jgi:hypothetical protein